MRKIGILFLMITFSIGSFFLFSQERRVNVVKKAPKISYSKKRALVIGIDSYPTLPLEAAVADANAVSKRLKELNFEVTTLLNREATLKAMRHELGTKLANTNPNDQVVIYFSGHGVTEQLHNNRKEGYILPVDANLRDLYPTAISMEQLRDLTRRIPARHILYIFDCCYSGLGLTRNAPSPNRENYLDELQGKRAVYMITAGKANEVAREVRGHGLFTLHFLDGIAGNADENRDGIVQASELGPYLAGVVSKDAKGDQNPQHGLLEGDGDFLFPLQDDDPIRLKESFLANLNFQLTELTKRKNLQAEFDRFSQALKESEKVVKDEYTQVISELDGIIREKQKEIESLKQLVKVDANADLSRQRYSVMKFLNTGIEFDILKTFPNIQETSEFYKKVIGFTVKNISLYSTTGREKLPDEIRRQIVEKLNKANPYKAKVKSYTPHWYPLQRDSYTISPHILNRVCSRGLIESVSIKTVTPSFVLQNTEYVNSPLRNDNTTIVEAIHFRINNIDGNDKLLTFDQVMERMVARYGEPTSKGRLSYSIVNWRTGGCDQRPEIIWEDDNVRLSLKVSGISAQDLEINLYNKSPMIEEIYSQAYKIFEAEQFILLKKRIAEMAELERKKTKEASKITF